MSTSTTQERIQHARGSSIRLTRKERGGGVAPTRNGRTTEAAHKESRESKIKAKKAIQETNGKRQDERTKRNEKGTRKGKGNTENDKKEGK